MQSIISALRGEAATSTGRAQALKKSADDVVITLALRTPMGKAKKGSFAAMGEDELMIEFFKGIISKMGIAPALVEDFTIGNCNTPGMAYLCRASALTAGFPVSTSSLVVNRFCSSGLMAVSAVSNQIRNNEIEIGLAVGFESMSSTPDRGPSTFSEALKSNQEAMDASMPMGWTSENVSKDFNITRERMDFLAAQSHQRAGRAQAEGRFDSEILPITALQYPTGSKMENRSERVPVLVTADDGIRASSTPEGLAKIRSAFPQWGNGTTTGGNASQITDGCAGVLMMKRSTAERLGLPILGRHVATSVTGLAPRVMGIGPAFAIPKLLKQLNLSKADIDLWEVNEAFASMFGYMIDTFGLPEDRTNVNGGAIALGHPLGCTGARQVATGLAELRRSGGKLLVTSMCIGTGQGAAALFVNEQ